MKSICVFTGSSRGNREVFAQLAQQLGAEIANRKLKLVYGASRGGLMGVIADAVLAQGQTVIGVIPEALCRKEMMHTGLSDTHIVKSMHERKALFAELSDGFIAMPGGWGTLEELFEVMTWAQLGFHEKPVGMLNVDGYFDEILQFLDKATDRGFVHPDHRAMLLVSDQPAELLNMMSDYQATPVSKWIDKADEL